MLHVRIHVHVHGHVVELCLESSPLLVSVLIELGMQSSNELSSLSIAINLLYANCHSTVGFLPWSALANIHVCTYMYV